MGSLLLSSATCYNVRYEARGTKDHSETEASRKMSELFSPMGKPLSLRKRCGRWLNRLKDERENGDYDIFTSFEYEDAKKNIEEADFLNPVTVPTKAQTGPFPPHTP